MRLVRLLPLSLLVLGVAAIAVAVACGGGDDAPTPSPTPDNSTPTATNTRELPTKIVHTPTPTVTPYDGAVARMQIPRFGVDAPIENLAINALNELDTPKQENTDVGWYYIYDKPGWHGNAVFAAHIYYHSIPAPFVSLAKAVAGDAVNIVMEDGTVYHYKVITQNRYNRDTIDMGKIIWPPERPANKEWITLITCGGALDSTGQEYVDRDVVVAERIDDTTAQ